MLRLIDTHAHLDEIEDVDTALRDASQAGVVAIVAVGSGYSSNQRVLEISQQYKDLVYPALGLHPWELAHMKPSEVERTLRQVEDSIRQAVAIGEVELDYDKRVRALVSEDRGRESRYTSLPKDVLKSLSAVSEIKGMEEAALAEQTTQNALRFFPMALSA